jgi:hypothetical protein
VEVLILEKEEFIEICQNNSNALETYNDIKEDINSNNRLDSIGISCYICGTLGHLAVNCSRFQEGFK